MALNVETLAQDLVKIVGEEYVQNDIFERMVYADTPVPYDLIQEEIPDVVVHPANTGEVSEVLKYANKNNIPVTTYGSGTSLIFSTKPKHKGIVLSTERLNWLKIDEDYQWFECGAGLKTGAAIKKLGEKGYFLPIQTQMGSSIGGAVCINTVGHLTDNIIGRPIHNVLGLEVVLPTGEIIETGAECLRRTCGWDLSRIFIGSEGTLGVITMVRMALFHMPYTADVAALFKNIEDIGSAIDIMYKDNIPLPLDGELVSEKCCKIGYEACGLDLPDGSLAIARAMGKTSEEAQENAQKLVELFKKAGAFDSFMLDDPDLKVKLWRVREDAMHWGQEKGLRGCVVIEVNPVLPKLPEAITEMNNIADGKSDLIGGLISETEAYLYGHIGSDSLHMLFVFPYEWDIEKAKQLTKEIWALEKNLQLKYGGVGGDWGWLPYRVPFYREKYGDVSYEILKKIKKVFDPNNILNRGNLEGEV